MTQARRELRYGEALRKMIGRNFRHLPVVDGDQRVIGMVSIRGLLERRLDELVEELNSVVSYYTADGPGG